MRSKDMAKTLVQRRLEIKAEMQKIEQEVSQILHDSGYVLEEDNLDDDSYWKNVSQYSHKETELKDDRGYYNLANELKSVIRQLGHKE
jgi:hypothetical protein